MGIFNKIFKSKPKQIKVIPLNNALSFFEQMLGEKEKQSLQDIEELRKSLPDSIATFSKSLNILEQAKVEEERAKGSQLAKDSYVKKSLKLIENINPEDYTDIEKVSNLLNLLVNLTPRQAIHMDFFFKEEMMQISKDLKKIKITLDSINNLKTSGVIKHKNSLNKLLNDEIKIESSLISYDKKIQELEKNKQEWVAEIKSKTEKLTLLEMDGMNEIKKDLIEMKKEKEHIQQRIDNSFGPAERFLKKFLYSIETTPDGCAITDDQKAILRMYTETSSHIAFSQDEDLVIKPLIQQSLEYARNDPEIFDAKRAEKVEILINEIGELAKDRKNLEQLAKDVQRKENEIQDIWIPKQKHKKSLNKEIDDLAINIDSIEREIIDIKQDIEIKKKKIPLIKEEISNLLTASTGIDVEVEE